MRTACNCPNLWVSNRNGHHESCDWQNVAQKWPDRSQNVGVSSNRASSAAIWSSLTKFEIWQVLTIPRRWPNFGSPAATIRLSNHGLIVAPCYFFEHFCSIGSVEFERQHRFQTTKVNLFHGTVTQTTQWTNAETYTRSQASPFDISEFRFSHNAQYYFGILVCILTAFRVFSIDLEAFLENRLRVWDYRTPPSDIHKWW